MSQTRQWPKREEEKDITHFPFLPPPLRHSFFPRQKATQPRRKEEEDPPLSLPFLSPRPPPFLGSGRKGKEARRRKKRPPPPSSGRKEETFWQTDRDRLMAIGSPPTHGPKETNSRWGNSPPLKADTTEKCRAKKIVYRLSPRPFKV